MLRAFLSRNALKGGKHMKKSFAILLIFLLLVLPAFAEERIDLSTPGSDNLTPYTLPDGRIIFAGSAGEKGD